jgi:hypothetical protein
LIFSSLSLVTVNEQQHGADRREDNFVTATGRTTREADDIILSSIIGFDVKAWDPGAPVFRVVATGEDDAVNPELVGVVMPGDAGYIPAVHRFILAPSSANNQPVSFGAYADLNYMGYLTTQATYTANVTATNFPVTRYAVALGTMGATMPGNYKMPYFAGPGDIASKNQAFRDNTWVYTPATYDTNSTHYEYDGITTINGTTGGFSITPTTKKMNWYTRELAIDSGMNMIDDNGNGLIDEPYERDAIPTYEKPLRGIRISIRAMEPDSKQVREVTVVHEFIPL